MIVAWIGFTLDDAAEQGHNRPHNLYHREKCPPKVGCLAARRRVHLAGMASRILHRFRIVPETRISPSGLVGLVVCGSFGVMTVLRTITEPPFRIATHLDFRAGAGGDGVLLAGSRCGWRRRCLGMPSDGRVPRCGPLLGLPA